MDQALCSLLYVVLLRERLADAHSSPLIITCSCKPFGQLALVRKQLWARATFRRSPEDTETVKVSRAFLERLTCALCFTAQRLTSRGEVFHVMWGCASVIQNLDH
jgi:hypothetical protein